MMDQVPSYQSVMCGCGHSARAHGPRVGERFHRQCWFCVCDEFEIAVERDMPIVGTTEIADELGVSGSWVRSKAKALGGVKDHKGQYRFLAPEAMEWAKRLIELSGYEQTIVFVCWECGDEQVMSRGKLGREVIEGLCLFCNGGK